MPETLLPCVLLSVLALALALAIALLELFHLPMLGRPLTYHKISVSRLVLHRLSLRLLRSAPLLHRGFDDEGPYRLPHLG